jgi:hypothetical protein
MQLNNIHKDILINELVKANEELKLAKDVSNASSSEWYIEENRALLNIRLFLLQQNIMLIEKCLIDNDINFNQK